MQSFGELPDGVLVSALDALLTFLVLRLQSIAFSSLHVVLSKVLPSFCLQVVILTPKDRRENLFANVFETEIHSCWE